jgi:sec-independent protein translocase protein TatA
MLPLAIFNLQPWEIVFVLILGLLLFGGKKLPSLAKDIGASIKEFRRSISSATSDEPEIPEQNQVVTEKKDEETTKPKARKNQKS